MEDLLFQTMVEEAEKEFLPEGVGGKLSSDGDSKKETGKAGDPEDEYCEELESCIMGELVVSPPDTSQVRGVCMWEGHT